MLVTVTPTEAKYLLALIEDLSQEIGRGPWVALGDIEGSTSLPVTRVKPACDGLVDLGLLEWCEHLYDDCLAAGDDYYRVTKPEQQSLF